MHLDEERIQRLLDGETAPVAERIAHEHLVACADCARLLEIARREGCEVAALLASLDVPAPRLDATAIAARAGRAHGPRSPIPGWGRKAAAVLIASALVGAAYAVPGSPLRGWIVLAVSRLGLGAQPEHPAPAAPAADAARPPGDAGIALAPGAGLLIEFRAREPRGRLRVTLVDGGDVVVRAPAGAARFASEEGRLSIANQGMDDAFEIDVPRSAPRVEIRVAGQRVFVLGGGRVTTDAPAGADGAYEISLSPERP